ncbi:MAG: alkane 1-monooxygenase, partial [Flavobacteriales bacterium]
MTKSLKYLLALTIPMFGYIALTNEGILAWSGLLYSFVLLPILDHVIPVNSTNYDSETIKQVEGDRFYNLILISLIPIQLFFLTWFLLSIDDPTLSSSTFCGRIFSMGILCGVIGINVGHELGHRTQKSLQFGAKILLSTSLYNHFFVEHNYGHHKNVGTPEDAASANRDEWVYVFMVRSAILGWINAWKIESKRLKRKGVSVVSFQNEVLRWQLLQWVALSSVFIFIGPVSGFAWIGAAVAGAVLLEATNYVEHYGLVRNKV